MSTGYGLEGIRQVCASLLGATRHVPDRLCGGSVYLGHYNKCSTFTFLPLPLAETTDLMVKLLVSKILCAYIIRMRVRGAWCMKCAR